MLIQTTIKKECKIKIFLYFSNKLRLLNNVKFILMSCVNLTIFSAIFYFGFLFNSVWTNWANQLISICVISIVSDFIFIEIIIELLISFMLALKMNFLSKYVISSLLKIKNLRNMN